MLFVVFLFSKCFIRQLINKIFNKSNDSTMKTKYEIPKEFLEEIGLITVKFMILERRLIFAFCKLTQIDSELIVRFISTDSFDLLLTKFKNIVIYLLESKNVLDNKTKSEIDSIYKLLDTINKDRNKVIHSLWLVLEDNTIIRHKYSRSIKRKNGYEVEKIDLTHLKELRKNIQQSTSSFVIFRDKIFNLLWESENKNNQ